jgi:predicted ABC-class ATPase
VFSFKINKIRLFLFQKTFQKETLRYIVFFTKNSDSLFWKKGKWNFFKKGRKSVREEKKSVFEKKKHTRPVGLEPTTSGFGNLRSTN